MKQKNIDYVRLLATLMIVAIHIYPFTFISEEFDYTFTRILFRMAVPLFLMITGFFVLPKALKRKEELEKYTLKILKIYIISMLIYLPVNIYNGYLSDINVFAFLGDIFINGPFYHLWYFPAVILGIWITYFVLKKVQKPLIIFLILYGIGILGDSYYGFIQGVPVLKQFYSFLFNIFDYTRNGIFYVPIFLYMGYSFYQFNNEKHENDRYYFLIFSISMISEGLLLYKYAIPRHTSMYFFLLPVSYFLGRILLTSNFKSSPNIRNISTWLYIFHPLFLVVVRLIAKVFHFENILVKNHFVMYLCVVFLTLLFIRSIEKLKRIMHYGK